MKILKRDEAIASRLNGELEVFTKAVSNSNKYFSTKEEYEAFLRSIEEYTYSRIYSLALQPPLQGIGYRKLADLYDLDIQAVELLKEVLTSSRFFDCVKWEDKLEVDFVEAQRIIDEQCEITYTKAQSDFLKALEGLEVSYKKLLKVGGSGSSQLFIVHNNGEIYPNTALIKAYIK